MELALAQPQIRRRRLEPGERRGQAKLEVEAVRPGREAREPESQRQVARARVDSLLERVPLGLGQEPGGDRIVDPVLQGPLERIAQLGRRDAELLGGIVDDSLALRPRRPGLRGRYSHPPACDGERSEGSADEL